MSEGMSWAGGELFTWGNGSSGRNTWGDLLGGIPIVDAPVPLSDLGLPFKNNPLSVWKNQPSLRKVVDFAARNVASVPLHVYVRDSDTDRRRDTDSTAVKLLGKPAPFVTGARLLHNLVVDSMLYDRWLVVYVDGCLKRVPAGLIDVKSDFLGGMTALRVRTPEGPVDITDAVVAYDAGWGGDREGGVSPMQTLAELLEEQRRAIKWRKDQWDNAAKLSGVLTHPGVMQRQNKERFVESWRAYRDTKAGGTPILEDGLKYEPIKQTKPADTQDLEGRRLTDAEVASAYHIPPELVGARQGTFSNIKAFREMLFGPVLGPTLTRIESAFNERIIPALAPEGAYCEFNRESAMSGSFAEQASYLQKTVGGPYMTRAEARAIQNLPYIEGTKELITPMNVTEGGLASPADTAPDGDQDTDEGIA